MKQKVLLIIGIFIFISVKAQSDYVIMENDTIIGELISNFKILPENVTPSELCESEFKSVNKLMTECIEKYNLKIKEGFKKNESKRDSKLFIIKNLKNYKIQFVPYLNEKGEKEVWVNGFCNDWDSDWRKELIYVFDGGNCYFTIKLNLTTGECLTIGTNGYA